MLRSRLAWVGLLLCCGGPLTAEDWPQWRGPRFDGTSQEKDVPTHWSKTENVLWRAKLPGPAGASPVVAGERIFLTSIDGGDLKVLCFDLDGHKKWERVQTSGNKEVRGDEGNSASNSPVTDGQHVWAMFTDGSLVCYDRDGSEVWKRDLQKDYGKFNIAFGMTSTPVLDGDRLFLQLLHTDGAWVVALDKSTGKELWKQQRPSDAKGEPLHAYASPMLYRDGEHEYLLTHGSDYVVAHRLSDGAELWRCGGFNPPPKGAYRQDFRFVSSPLPAPGLIVVPSCKNGVTVALRPNGKGDVTAQSEFHIWKHESTPDVPSPLYHDGLVYLCGADGILVCLDAKTGEQYYQKRIHPQRHRGSPVYAAGHIYCISRDDGVVTVVKAGREGEIVSKNEIGEGISASPAISNGRIYLRSSEALYAIGKK